MLQQLQFIADHAMKVFRLFVYYLHHNDTGDEAMTTKLTDPLRREIEIDGELYTILLTPLGIRLSRKRYRGGRLVTWRTLWNHDDLERPDTPGVTP